MDVLRRQNSEGEFVGQGGGFCEGWAWKVSQYIGRLQVAAPAQRPKVIAGMERNSRIGRFMQRTNSEWVWHQFKAKNVELLGVGSRGAHLVPTVFLPQ